jgi:hypothetical protein
MKNRGSHAHQMETENTHLLDDYTNGANVVRNEHISFDGDGKGGFHRVHAITNMPATLHRASSVNGPIIDENIRQIFRSDRRKSNYLSPNRYNSSPIWSKFSGEETDTNSSHEFSAKDKLYANSGTTAVLRVVPNKKTDKGDMEIPAKEFVGRFVSIYNRDPRWVKIKRLIGKKENNTLRVATFYVMKSQVSVGNGNGGERHSSSPIQSKFSGAEGDGSDTTSTAPTPPPAMMSPTKMKFVLAGLQGLASAALVYFIAKDKTKKLKYAGITFLGAGALSLGITYGMDIVRAKK